MWLTRRITKTAGPLLVVLVVIGVVRQERCASLYPPAPPAWRQAMAPTAGPGQPVVTRAPSAARVILGGVVGQLQRSGPPAGIVTSSIERWLPRGATRDSAAAISAAARRADRGTRSATQAVR